MPNLAAAGSKSLVLNVTIQSALPFTAVSRTISSFGSFNCGLQRTWKVTGREFFAQKARNRSIVSYANLCLSNISGRLRTLSYSRNSGTDTSIKQLVLPTSCNSLLEAPWRLMSPLRITFVSSTILIISYMI